MNQNTRLIKGCVKFSLAACKSYTSSEAAALPPITVVRRAEVADIIILPLAADSELQCTVLDLVVDDVARGRRINNDAQKA